MGTKRKTVTVVLDSAQWMKGERGACLLTSDTRPRLCCMGFAALALGATREDILQVANWEGAADGRLHGWDYIESQGQTRARFARLYAVNDDPSTMPDEVRVATLNAVMEDLETEPDHPKDMPRVRFVLGVNPVPPVPSRLT